MVTIPAPAGALHERRRRLGEPERAVDIGLKDDTPVVLADLFDRTADLPAHTTGGVHQNIQLALARDDRVHDIRRGLAL